jgi:hypothetical protein
MSRTPLSAAPLPAEPPHGMARGGTGRPGVFRPARPRLPIGYRRECRERLERDRRGTGRRARKTLEVQRAEWQLPFDYCAAR